MSTVTHAPLRLEPRPAAARLAAAARKVLDVLAAVRGRRVVADLGRLDDRMLKDIGLTRSDLRDAAGGPMLEDPTVVLFHRAAERRGARHRSRADLAADTAERISAKHFVPYY